MQHNCLTLNFYLARFEITARNNIIIEIIPLNLEAIQGIAETYIQLLAIVQPNTYADRRFDQSTSFDITMSGDIVTGVQSNKRGHLRPQQIGAQMGIQRNRHDIGINIIFDTYTCTDRKYGKNPLTID